MKKNERNLVILLGIVLFLLVASKTQTTYDVFEIIYNKTCSQTTLSYTYYVFKYYTCPTNSSGCSWDSNCEVISSEYTQLLRNGTTSEQKTGYMIPNETIGLCCGPFYSGGDCGAVSGSKAIIKIYCPLPNPPTPNQIDIFAIFNQLFSMIWSALKALFGWLTV